MEGRPSAEERSQPRNKTAPCVNASWRMVCLCAAAYLARSLLNQHRKKTNRVSCKTNTTSHNIHHIPTNPVEAVGEKINGNGRPPTSVLSFIGLAAAVAAVAICECRIEYTGTVSTIIISGKYLYCVDSNNQLHTC